MHRLHHATAPQYHNRTYAFDFVFWDRIFGTYASPDSGLDETLSIGLDDNPFNGRSTTIGILTTGCAAISCCV
jgi:sterol desaturase/sphingolipid hydroxylase (fatty acid hydroxylase superfamily)